MEAVGEKVGLRERAREVWDSISIDVVSCTDSAFVWKQCGSGSWTNGGVRVVK